MEQAMHPATEGANPNTQHIDQLDTRAMLALMNQEDAKVAAAVERALPQIAAAVDAITAAIENGGRLFYVGAGTSGRLGVLDAVECLPTFSTPPQLVQGIIAGGSAALTRAVEGAEDSPEQGRQDLMNRQLRRPDVVCGIAASGSTPYVIGALEYARSLAAQTIAIACSQPAPILDIAAVAIALDVGPEIIAGSSRLKAGSAQKMTLNMLSTATMIKLGKVYGNLMVDVKVSNRKLAKRAERLVMQLTALDAAAARQLLTRADSHVKTAVVMHHRQVDRPTAQRLLAEAGGRLSRLIDAQH